MNKLCCLTDRKHLKCPASTAARQSLTPSIPCCPSPCTPLQALLVSCGWPITHRTEKGGKEGKDKEEEQFDFQIPGWPAAGSGTTHPPEGKRVQGIALVATQGLRHGELCRVLLLAPVRSLSFAPALDPVSKIFAGGTYSF